MSADAAASRRAADAASLGVGQPEGEQLTVEPLPAEVVELDLSREVGPDDVLHLLADGRLEQVAVDPSEAVHLVWKRDRARWGVRLGCCNG